MSKLGEINITQKHLDAMNVIKKEDNSIKPKIWLSNNILYKKDDFCTIKRYKEYFELFNDYEELKNCVFPENTFNVDGRYMGYTTTFFDDYNRISFRMNKNKYDINQKKKIMKKIVKLLKNMHNLDIVHADFHTDNVICNKKDIKIIDFEKMRIKELEDKPIYMLKLREDIYYLNLMILSVLFDCNMSYIYDMEYEEFIYDMSFNTEFKHYLINSFKHKEDEIPKELLEYIDSIKRRDIVNGKELIKSLHL